MKKMKKNNKGFSLVELIIVIAIMAVLVGVLAPQFIKYVEQSRRGTDIQNAEQIRTAILADMADGRITASGTACSFENAANTYGPQTIGASTIAVAPKVQGNLGTSHGTSFMVNYNVGAGTCDVYVVAGSGVTYILTNPLTAGYYKTDETPTTH